MTQRTRCDWMLELGLLGELGPVKQARLAEISTVQRFAGGQTIFREGQTYTKIHWVCRGRVTLEMTSGAKVPKSLLTIETGELLAWSALVGNQRMSATAIAIIDTVLLGFEIGDLLHLCEADHEIGYRLMRQVAQGLSSRLLATRLQYLDLFNDPGELVR